MSTQFPGFIKALRSKESGIFFFCLQVDRRNSTLDVPPAALAYRYMRVGGRYESSSMPYCTPTGQQQQDQAKRKKGKKKKPVGEFLSKRGMTKCFPNSNDKLSIQCLSPKINGDSSICTSIVRNRLPTIHFSQFRPPWSVIHQGSEVPAPMSTPKNVVAGNLRCRHVPYPLQRRPRPPRMPKIPRNVIPQGSPGKRGRYCRSLGPRC